ncbi:phthiotriol/phenolphthiotriol dimycocerosates methyltransferase [Actinocatenispora thailandica]|uniref:Phthiotriol/phenolphthiotriol dimycocerosates methyltransferase n=1 Tax=Actinocatenispora thailandica TaxID=227318 RepID=A0A7R7DM27_9ACTN|nr:class I SAM-dependent methyltransferase [Actinocatenispora thailandica]BCJ33857.1 phthiotriol/phenolphthiotriol dimycocerosates methyltransferase [Actinocatenispora thailandica]
MAADVIVLAEVKHMDGSHTIDGSARTRLARRLAQRQSRRAPDGQDHREPESPGPLMARDNSTGAFYDVVTSRLDSTPVGRWALFLNLGYADGPDDRACVDLPRNTLDRASVKLVLELIGDCTMDGRRVLDVGSGRGGTVSALLNYFNPAIAVGIDLSPAAAAFSRRAVTDRRAGFSVGDAQRLPFSSGSFDVVTNVESSHCYPDRRRFYAEVRRVLCDGGTFLYSDLLDTATLDNHLAGLRELGLALQLDRDITANVLASCGRIAERRLQSFGTEDDAARDFLSAPGSPTYEALRTGQKTFFIWRLRAA